jgi:hypothetical protein
MGSTSHNIDIIARVKAEISGLDKVVKDMQDALTKGTTKIDLTRGVGQNLSRLINKFQDDYSKVKTLSVNNLVSLDDSKEF